MSNRMNNKQYKELLNDIVCDQCTKDYCFLKELLINIHPSERLLMQVKCIEKFKFEKSKEEGHDIGWAKATDLWVSEGHAANFSICYADNKRYIQIYKEVMNS